MRHRAWLEILLDEEEAARRAAYLREAYEALYGGRQPIRHLRSFYLWLLDLIRPEPGRRLLDVACGQGDLHTLARARGVEAYGLDLAETALRAGRRRGGEGFLLADGERLPFPGACFDYVTNIGSLEHFPDPLQGVREMARVLRPGGEAWVLLPNTYSILGNVWTALRQGRSGEDHQPIQRYAARREWEEVLEEGGLRVRRVVKYERERPRTREDLLWYLRHPKPLVRLLLTPFVPLNWASCFVFQCVKEEG